MLQENEVNKKTWNAFVKKNGPRSGRFLHSYEWGEFQKATGNKVTRLVWKKKDAIQAAGLIVKKQLRFFGSYTYCPRGPIVSGDFKIKPRDLKKSLGGVFFRFEQTDEKLFDEAKLVSEIQPSHTLITDLSLSEEELLKNMHEKTRYNIRLATKKKVRVAFQSASFEEVWKLFEQTSTRGGFRLHGKTYYEKMIENLGSGDCKAFLATAWHDEDLLAANIMIDFDKTRTYLHGASSNKKRNLMGPYLLHWELMRSAKSEGMKEYDWWGVAPEGADKNHPWSGISRFKRGFDGEEIAYHGTYDLVFDSIKYSFYRLLQFLRGRRQS